MRRRRLRCTAGRKSNSPDFSPHPRQSGPVLTLLREEPCLARHRLKFETQSSLLTYRRRECYFYFSVSGEPDVHCEDPCRLSRPPSRPWRKAARRRAGRLSRCSPEMDAINIPFYPPTPFFFYLSLGCQVAVKRGSSESLKNLLEEVVVLVALVRFLANDEGHIEGSEGRLVHLAAR